MGGFYNVRVNLGKFPPQLRGLLCFFLVLALFFRPSLPQFRALPPIKNYIFGISSNRAVSSESSGLIL